MINGLKIQCKSILPLLGGGGPKQGEDEQQEGKGHTVVTVTQEVMVAWGGRVRDVYLVPILGAITLTTVLT